MRRGERARVGTQRIAARGGLERRRCHCCIDCGVVEAVVTVVIHQLAAWSFSLACAEVRCEGVYSGRCLRKWKVYRAASHEQGDSRKQRVKGEIAGRRLASLALGASALDSRRFDRKTMRWTVGGRGAKLNEVQERVREGRELFSQIPRTKSPQANRKRRARIWLSL